MACRSSGAGTTCRKRRGAMAGLAVGVGDRGFPNRLSAEGHRPLAVTAGAHGSDRQSAGARPDVCPSPAEARQAVPRLLESTGLARHWRRRLPLAGRRRGSATGLPVPAPKRSDTSSPAMGPPPGHSTSPASASPAKTAPRPGAVARPHEPPGASARPAPAVTHCRSPVPARSPRPSGDFRPVRMGRRPCSLPPVKAPNLASG
jgi:hypothetical protein